MPVKSPLAPETIVGRRPTNLESAKKFISGGSPLGASVVASASNKIVGFQRAGVKPVTPDINSLVKTISSNILSEVNTRIDSATNLTNKRVDAKIRDSNNVTRAQIQNITKNQTTQVTQLQNITQKVQQTLSNTIQSIIGDYRKKITEVDAAKPTDILGKFLDTYKNALDFIRFFGNNKNIKILRDALKELSKSFIESFEVAKLIRKTILRIVSQLSNLPKASPGAGSGINLDINTPRGALRKTGPKMPRSQGRGRLGLLAGLGLAGAGTMAVNALSDSNIQPQASGVQIPESFTDRFAQIVEKFANAIESMIKGPKKKSSSGGGGGGGGGSSTSSPGSSPGGMPTGSMDVTADTEEERTWLKTIRQVEGTSDETGYNKLVGGEVVPELTQMTLQEIYDLGMGSRIGEGVLPQRFGGRKVKFGADSHAMGAYQFIPQTMMSVARQLGMDPNTTIFTPEIQDRLGLKNLTNTGVDPTKRATIQDMDRADDQWAGLGPRHGQTTRTLKQSLEIWNKTYGKSGVSAATGMGGMGVDPSKLDLETKTLTASKIAQPPPQESPSSSVSMVPLDLSGGKKSGGSAPMMPPQRAGKGPEVPLLPSSDPDNFMTMYSRIIYNIVDG